MSEVIIMTATKKRIQVQVDEKLAKDTEVILDQLGLTPTTVITMMYKRIVANGGIPFDISLTDGEKATLELTNTIEGLPITKLETTEEIEDWFSDETLDC
ncbi:type II toxin-antitoxin system RelB/DinJ family antitoxin [Jeotgalibaca sp. PTS2502]|uniref:type II toxin-antitoxin system RelB/DinJ family antitoxin n=1 Tax=Jeotgalibaca sp. PTS2502 TaxID=1903686 RepID=UPI001E4EA9A8|nr:type II toxin-antitoxin system RelB/DinJ family antitoxin [Jeotgalibaca sp. PTS2502]